MDERLAKLPIEEKIKLAEELWENIEKERSLPLTPEQQKLLEQRYKQHLENPTAGKSWKEIRSKYFNQ
jgi:putative addiction module component (TIGR02574 family)